MEKSDVQVRASVQHADRREPVGDTASKSSIMREDVGVHEPFKKGEAQQARQFRQRLFEIRTRPLAVIIGEIGGRADGGNRSGLHDPQLSGIKRPFEIHWLSEGPFDVFGSLGEGKELNISE